MYARRNEEGLLMLCHCDEMLTCAWIVEGTSKCVGCNASWREYIDNAGGTVCCRELVPKSACKIFCCVTAELFLGRAKHYGLVKLRALGFASKLGETYMSVCSLSTRYCAVHRRLRTNASKMVVAGCRLFQKFMKPQTLSPWTSRLLASSDIDN